MTFQFPNIPEAEAEFLGRIVEHPPALMEVIDRVPEHAFQNQLTRSIWREMVALQRAGTAVSIPMLRERVKDDPQRYGVPSVPAFLATCAQQSKGGVNVYDLADLLAQRGMEIELAKALQESSAALAKGEGTAEDIAASVRSRIETLLNSSKGADTITFAEAAKAFAGSVAKAYQRGQPIGSDWGLKKIDNIAGMITEGDFIVLGGPSGHGKSALAQQVCMHFAARRPTLQITAEMQQTAIAGREILGRTGIGHAVIESGDMSPAEVEAILEKANAFDGLPYELCYTGDMRISKIRARIEAFKHRWGGCGLVVVDTIKHVDPEDKGARSKIDKVIASADKLQKLAAATGVPIMALAQVKEQYYERPGSDFYANDLYGGGDLRELADTVLLIHQPYEKLVGMSGKSGRDRDDLETQKLEWKGYAQAICAKRRRGRKGTAKLGWDGPKTRFFDPEDDQESMF